MLNTRAMARWLAFAQTLVTLGFFIFTRAIQAQTNSPANNVVELVAAQGTVEVARTGQSVWDPASTAAPYRRLNPGDQIRTKDRSRAAIRLSDLTLVELGPNAHLQLLPVSERQPGLGLKRGLLHLFHRDKPDAFYFRTPTASPVIRGTEFTLDVAEDGATTLQLLDGAVTLTNELGLVELNSGDAAVVQPGRAPQRTASLEAVSVIQWCLYYPAVLRVDELQLSADEQNVLADSLVAYRRGDLLKALENFPSERTPDSDREKVYLAALLLAVGDVAGSETLMNSLSRSDARAVRLANALQTLIAVVKGQPLPEQTQDNEPLASVWLALSYHQQSRYALEPALDSARKAVEVSPGFAFGWARVAELEFGFGRTRQARLAVQRALDLAPRHAQAMAVNGFLLAAQNLTVSALTQFDEAIAADNALGNAWLGRGLCRFRQGDARGGLADLLVAASLEPNRAVLRSYLGKGFSESGDVARAERELARAAQLDTNDPTSWLYLALLHQQHNRVNDAIHDLERSQALNDNRQIYRSRLLLDQDRAVRQANLASVYQDAGLFDESVREAARAVNSDYANASAHTFLANSYSGLRDPGLANLRYETATLSEYLVGQLLAPVGGSALSPYVSQQDYTRLFEQRGFGLSSGTEYLSGGDWRQHGAQYGVFDRFDYSLDAYYESQNGERPNNDLTLRQFSVATRFQLTPQDTVFVQAVDSRFESGDTRQYYEPTNANSFLRVKEEQSPNVFAGYHRAWSPGSHTLLLVSRLADDFRLDDEASFIPTLTRFFGSINGQVIPFSSAFTNRQHAEFRAWSAELQQILQTPDHTLVLGARFQSGGNDSRFEFTHNAGAGAGQTYPVTNQSVETELRRAGVYAYDSWVVCDRLQLIGGVSYDWLDYPQNIDLPPVMADQTRKDQLSPKAGFIWQMATNLTMRGAYTRSLGGLYFDNSVRLEPAQVAGFNQAYRSLIPESLAGIVAGAEFETANLDLSWQPRAGTYLGLGAEWLQSEGARQVGMFDWSTIPPAPIVAVNTPQRLEFEEKSLTADFNQLIGRDWSVGVRYRVSAAELDQRLTEIPEAAVWQARVEDEGRLHQIQFSARYTHPGGFFAGAQALLFVQDSQHHHNVLLPDQVPDEEFWQFNVFAGWRFAGRRAELRVGVLNLTDEDYHLNPINVRPWLPRERTFVAGFRFNF
ncbi:MAG: TonB-dependent receptor [Verrucomicrobia bacterium]|nr:TonB-dependent receptor [Verrucomicrobiota bacterium]